MQRIWSSKVKVAERRGGREEEDDEDGLCTVTWRQRESSLSVRT